jgi:putative RecB family exonuclease
MSVLSPSLRRVGDENMAESAGAQAAGAQAAGVGQAGAQAAGVGQAGARLLPAQPADAPATPGDAVPDDAVSGLAAAAAGTGPSLSPSRAADFLTCPLLYRFRVVDRLPEPPSPAAARGTLVHAVLERLFDEPAACRTPETARAMLAPQLERLIADEPELAGMFSDSEERGAWLAEAAEMLDRYFTLEDPARIEPRHREHAVEAVLESGLLLRGFIDRVDVRADGEIRIVDYKTGSAPREEYEARALFQMKFYAVVLWLTQQRVPKLLQLMYLGNGEVMRYAPDESDLRATVRKIDALWRAIERARVTGDWRPRQSRLCDWCAHQSICPAFGGTPPPLPDRPSGSEIAPPADAAVPSQRSSSLPNPPEPAAAPALGASPGSPASPAAPAAPGASPASPAASPQDESPQAEIPAQPSVPENAAAPAPPR